MALSSSSREMTPAELQVFFNANSAIKADFHMLTTRLKRRQVTGSQQCARATLEFLRTMIARYNFNSTEHMMRTVKAAGRELVLAAPAELTIGNLVRRVLFAIREEHSIHHSNSQPVQTTKPERKPRSGSRVAYSDDEDEEASMSIPEPASPSKLDHVLRPSPSLESMLGHLSVQEADDYHKQFLGLKAAVISALNEMSMEIDNYVPICQRAPDFIHVDECILTYGYSKVVETFLKAAGAKRRFQLIIAEGGPQLEDSNIYAMMARVNKVIFSPQAIMADGGTIVQSGLLMVATAAKEFSVPVVGISSAFTLTPLFAHNQQLALQQLLSPTAAIPYNADINFSNVEVSYPAFDHLPPNLVSLYVTNDGSQLPSFIFRQLSEYYHPKDYVL